MRKKRKVEMLREWFENVYKEPALTKRGLPTKFYYEVMEDFMAKMFFRELPKEESLREDNQPSSHLDEFPNFSRCKVCGKSTTAFYNASYYDMFTVRCENCQTEVDYATKQEAFINEYK